MLLGLALAAEPEPPVEASLHGDVKTFVVATLPYEHELMPPDPTGQGIADLRLKLEVEVGEELELEVHHTTTALTAAASSGVNTGVGLQAPEAVDLSWVVFDNDLTLRGRVDRLALTGHAGRVDIKAGRQAISFGSGQFFTPMDLVNPFNPSVVDQEYKPGVDALRLDGYAGTASSLTLVAAYAGDTDLEGLTLAAYGQSTLGVTDVGLFFASVRAEPVVGASVVSSVGPVGVHGDATLTVSEADGTFVRAVAGGFWRPTTTTTVSAEGYVQTVGTTDPDEYLVQAQSERYASGELWLFNVPYAGVSVAQEITPMITGSAASIVNLGDGSAFLSANLAWSVSGNTNLAFGGFYGLGARPDPLEVIAVEPIPVIDPGLKSEFGFYPGSAFLQMSTYF